MPRLLLLAAVLIALMPGALHAGPRSPALAESLIAALDERKLEAISARLPGEGDRYVAAIRVADTGLMVIDAHYSVPALINERIWRGDHRDVYLALNSGSPREGRRFIQDLGPAGLHASRDDGVAFDLIYDSGALWLKLDGDWEGQKMSRQEYAKRVASADERYAASLKVLLDALAAVQAPAGAR
ncbi:MAG: hypothetical protein ABIT71_19580 [Vicinamibacteraceae bacterium]